MRVYKFLAGVSLEGVWTLDFEIDGNTEHGLSSNDLFGNSVSLSGDGATLAASAPDNDAGSVRVWVYGD